MHCTVHQGFGCSEHSYIHIITQETGGRNAVPTTDTAKEHRLRRICQKRRNGTLIVPQSVHEQWKAGGVEKQKLMDKLDSVGWDRVSGLQSVQSSHTMQSCTMTGVAGVHLC